jgi:hypothetical protein
MNLPSRPPTEALIQALVIDASPVRRLRAPRIRAALWLGTATLAAAAMIFAVTGITLFKAGAANPRALAEWWAMVATGIVGITAAHHLAIPGHSPYWRKAAWWPAALWLSLAVAGCLSGANGVSWTDGSNLWHYLECFGFVVGCGVPLAIVLSGSVRRALPVWPTDTAIQGCLGVGALAIAFMRFFHPVDLSVIDLASHLTALALVVGAGALRASVTLLP